MQFSTPSFQGLVFILLTSILIRILIMFLIIFGFEIYGLVL